MVSKEEYKRGELCKGICMFCKDNRLCYQGIQTMKGNKESKKPKFIKPINK